MTALKLELELHGGCRLELATRASSCTVHQAALDATLDRHNKYPLHLLLEAAGLQLTETKKPSRFYARFHGASALEVAVSLGREAVAAALLAAGASVRPQAFDALLLYCPPRARDGMVTLLAGSQVRQMRSNRAAAFLQQSWMAGQAQHQVAKQAFSARQAHHLQACTCHHAMQQQAPGTAFKQSLTGRFTMPHCLRSTARRPAQRCACCPAGQTGTATLSRRCCAVRCEGGNRPCKQQRQRDQTSSRPQRQPQAPPCWQACRMKCCCVLLH